MRLAALAALAALALIPPRAAHACPAPREDLRRVQLTLVTDPTVELPPNGGLLVRRANVAGGDGALDGPSDRRTDGASDDAWTVRVAGGAAVGVEVTVIGDGLERWRLDGGGARTLEVVDAAGAVVATIHQTARRGRALPAPRIKRLRSTGRGADGPAYGVPAGKMTLELASPPPAGARYLVATLAQGDVPWFVIDAPTGRTIVRETYAHKACARGPSPVLSGQRLRFRWVDAAGRMSAPTVATTVRADG